jgi:hypothetical protein
MRIKSILIILALISVLLLSGCVQLGSEDTELFKEPTAKSACIDICNSVKGTQDLSNGPCLSDDNPNWNIDDWVCDVAHSPRQDIDNLPENQCQEYREGKVHHFVEVDSNCELIRAV